MTMLNAQYPAAQLFGMLGIPPQGLMQQLSGIKQQAGLLHNLIDNFQKSAGGMTGSGLAQLAQQGSLPTSTQTSGPNASSCPCTNQYFKPQQIDFGTAPGAAPGTPQNLEHRARGMRLERFLSQNPFARHQLEGRLGGRILNDGLMDGKLTVQRQPGGLLGGQPAAGHTATALNSLGGIQRGAAYAGNPGAGPGAFQGMMLGALTNALGGGGLLPGAGARGGFPGAAAPGGFPGAAPGGFPQTAAPQRRAYRRPIGFDDILKKGLPGQPGGAAQLGGFPGAAAGGFPGAAPGGFPGAAAPAGLGGAPAGGLPGGTPGAAAGGAPGGTPGAAFGGLGGGGLGNVFNEPGLTVEDKVVMLLMQITKGFDKKIQDQANKLNALQQQQGQGGGAGGKGGAGGGGDKSIDVESMKLKRLIDKRGQMFDMLRQIIDKYNETAKNMIQAVGR